MKTKILVSIIFTILFISTLITAQPILDQQSAKDRANKFSISFGTGLLFNGPGIKIANAMKESGFDAPPRDLGRQILHAIFNPTADYPDNKPRIPWNTNISYYATDKSKFSISYCLLSHQTITGYDEADLPASGDVNGNYLELQSTLRTFGLGYSLGLNQRKHEFSIDLLLGKYAHQEKFEAPKKHKVLPGVNLGYTINITNRKNLILGFKASYNWLPKVNIGPFERSNVDPGNHENIHRSIFPEMEISLASFNVGIIVGFKL